MMFKRIPNVLNKLSVDYLLPRRRSIPKLSNISRINQIPNLKIRSYSNQLAPRVFSKKFLENSYAYSALEPLPSVIIPKRFNLPVDNVRTEDDFNRFLNKNWRKCTVNEIVDGFNEVLPFCIENNVDVSDKRFDLLVNGLLDNIENLSTDDIISVLKFLTEAPLPEGVNANNYHDVWSALDDVCCWKLKKWDLQTCLRVADYWYKLGLGRIADFIYELLYKYSRKPGRLTKSELVYMFFYFNVCRKRKMDFLYEDAIEKLISSMTPTEIGIVAMGFFKTQTKVKSPVTLNTMIECAIRNSKTIHEIALASIVKTVRLSHHPLTVTKSAEFLDIITPEIDRLSNVCCLHIALLGMSLLILNEKTLTAIAEKISKDINDINAVRLKDIERFFLAITAFDYKPVVTTTDDIYDLFVRQFYNPLREPEMKKHPKCLPSSLLFLGVRNIYPEDLISRVLDPKFIRNTYGKRHSDLPRELYTLDMNVEIDRPDYKGHRIPIDIRRRCAKIFIERLPRREKKSMNVADRLIHDVVDCCSNLVGDSSKIFLGHILPHYVKSDIVLCYDSVKKEFITPILPKYQIGDIVEAPKTDNLKWIVVLPVSINTTIRYLLKPAGHVNMKVRQLKLLGYEVVMIPYHEYLPLEDDDKMEYISKNVLEVLR